LDIENKESENSLEGYRGLARELLDKSKVKIGQRVIVDADDEFRVEGLLIPRYEHADEEHIVLKLKSGYNIGIDVKKIGSLSRTGKGHPVKEDNIPESPKIRVFTRSAAKVLLMSTGGTIASRIDYRTGAVHPALSAEDLRSAIPELESIASIEPEVVFSTYSENISPSHWQSLSERIVSRSKERFSGFVIMIGTDTLAYVSAALSFSMIGLSQPVICVGSQRSSDRPSSDSALNLKAAVLVAARFARSGVYVAMHANENDDDIAIHFGTRVRKNHTSRRDAFRSIDSDYAALVRGQEIVINDQQNGDASLKPSDDFKLKTKFERSVSLIKFHPGFDSRVLDFLLREGKVKGIIIEGTGLGHVSHNIISSINGLISEGVFVGMTSQCIWGHVDLNVYDTGRDLIRAGVVPLGNLFGETAFAKLSWVLGNFQPEKWPAIMQESIIGEQTARLFVK